MEQEKKERPKRLVKQTPLFIDNPELDKARKKKRIEKEPDKVEAPKKLTAAQQKAAEKKRLKEEAAEEKRLAKEKKAEDDAKKKAESKTKKVTSKRVAPTIKDTGTKETNKKDLPPPTVPKPSPLSKKPKGYQQEVAQKYGVDREQLKKSKRILFADSDDPPRAGRKAKKPKKVSETASSSEDDEWGTPTSKGKKNVDKPKGGKLSQATELVGKEELKGFESSDEDSQKSPNDTLLVQSKFNIVTETLSSQEIPKVRKDTDNLMVTGEESIDDIDMILSRATSVKVNLLASEMTTKLNQMEHNLKAWPTNTENYLTQIKDLREGMANNLNKATPSAEQLTWMSSARETTQQLEEKLNELKEELRLKLDKNEENIQKEINNQMKDALYYLKSVGTSHPLNERELEDSLKQFYRVNLKTVFGLEKKNSPTSDSDGEPQREKEILISVLENNSPGGKNLFKEMVKYTDDKARKRKFRLRGRGKTVAFSEQTQVREFTADPDPETEAYERVLKMNGEMEEWRKNFLTTENKNLSIGQIRIIDGQIEKLIDTLTTNMSQKNVPSDKKSEMVDVAEKKWEEIQGLYNFMRATQSKLAQGSPQPTEEAELVTGSQEHIDETEVGPEEGSENSIEINKKIHTLIQTITEWKENVFIDFGKSIETSKQTNFKVMTDAIEVVITTLRDATKDPKKTIEEKEEILKEGTDFFDEFKLEMTCRKNNEDRNQIAMEARIIEFFKMVLKC